MGANNSFPCLCQRARIKTPFKVTNRFMSVDTKLKLLIFSFLGFETEILQVVVFSSILRKELIPVSTNVKFGFDAIRIVKSLQENFRNKSDSHIYSLNECYAVNFGVDAYIWAVTIFMLDRHSKSENKYRTVNVDLPVNSNTQREFSNFLISFLKLYIQIASNLFSDKIKMSISIRSDEFNTMQRILEFLITNITTIEIDLVIPEAYCSSTLSMICNSRRNLMIRSLNLEKVSQYQYGVNLLEKKVDQNLEKIIILEKRGRDSDEESLIYDVVNLNSVCSLINLNKQTLREVYIDTDYYLNVISDDFYNSLSGCSILEKLDIKSKISKLNVEVFKNTMIMKNLKYFDLDLTKIKEEDFLDKLLIGIITEFIISENIFPLPFAKKLFILSEFSSKLKIDFSKYQEDELTLDFNTLSAFELDNCKEDFIRKSVLKITEFISSNNVNSLRIIHTILFNEYAVLFIKALFEELNKRESDHNNNIQIEKFILIYEDDKVETIFDGIFTFFLKSEVLREFEILRNYNKKVDIHDTETELKEENKIISKSNANKVHLAPVFKFEFTIYSSNKWILLLKHIIENIPSHTYYSLIQLYFVVENENFSNLFSDFMITLGKSPSDNCIINSLSLNISNYLTLNETNLKSLFSNCSQSLKFVQTLKFIPRSNMEGIETIKETSKSTSHDWILVNTLVKHFSNLKKIKFKDKNIEPHLLERVLVKCNKELNNVLKFLQVLDISGLELKPEMLSKILTKTNSDSDSNLKKLKLRFRLDALKHRNTVDELNTSIKEILNNYPHLMVIEIILPLDMNYTNSSNSSGYTVYSDLTRSLIENNPQILFKFSILNE